MGAVRCKNQWRQRPDLVQSEKKIENQ